MENIEIGKIDKMIIHFVGNKSHDDGVRFSKIATQYESIEDSLVNLISKNFKSEELYCFYFEPNIELNPIYKFISTIFSNKEDFIEQSQNCSRYLYDKSTHPNIKGGEFYCVYIRDCLFNGKITDAIGLFKSENKDTFLKATPSTEGYSISSEKGQNINRLDKGCLVFNLEKENGFIVTIVDNINNGNDAHYWIDEFLHLRARKDEYYNTKNILNICRNFATKEFPKEFEISKTDQIDLLNKSVKFFKENETFNIDAFTKKVITKPDVINSFIKYKSDFQKERDVNVEDSFLISNSAVKKQARVLKSVIKLDTNFDIYVHGNRELIEQGVDENGRKFYKIFYKEEN